MDKYLPEELISRSRYLEILSWSREDAENANELWVETDIDPNWQKRNPIALWQTIKNIEQYQQLYSSGDKRAALHALYLSLSSNLPAPEWAVAAFISAYSAVNHYEVEGWDDVFGLPNPKNTNVKAKRKKRELCLKVYDRISEIKNTDPDAKVDAKLFEQVGKEFNLGKTLTEEFYYLVNTKFSQMIPKRKKRNTKKVSG